MAKAPARKPTAIDLFCGAGGLASSLEATGWETVAAVDFDRDCINTLHANKERGYLRNAALVHDDIANVQGKDLRPRGASVNWRPDLLSGGPPCQPFSSAGRMLALNDPRGRLFKEFVRIADELKPRFILFENVAGLVTAKDLNGEVGGVLRNVQHSFEEIGYACRFDLLNAADFGAPQRRVRLYMVATLDEVIPEFPNPTHGRDGLPRPWQSIGQFLLTQEPPLPEDIVRPPLSKLEALSRLTPGTGLRSTGIVEANRPSGHWGYRQDSFLADLSAPSRTIRAASTPDWLRLPGEEEMRRITWRECAGLQGFPVDWVFTGTFASKFRQIGNAVQGHIGRMLGKQLLQAALKVRKGTPQSLPWPRAFHRRVRYTAQEEIVNGHVRRVAKGGDLDGHSAEMV